MSGAGVACRLAKADEKDRIVAFLDAHWGTKHPLVHLTDFFSYYYEGPDGALQFALAEQDGALVAVAGYIRANLRKSPDIWVSIWCAKKGCNGAGLELMAALPGLTGARVMACNNIRPRTMAFYTFLGYTAARMPHFYRLADKNEYVVADVAHKVILPAGGAAELTALTREMAARLYVPDETLAPYKDAWYVCRRYFDYPRQKYHVYGVPEKDGKIRRILATRIIPVNGTCVLRIADYIGPAGDFAALGGAIDRLMQHSGAEYADCYCAGVDPAVMTAAGFCERAENDANIIPNYLTPLARENTEYYYFTTKTENFTMFKADGDQDRPNVPVE